MDDKLRIYYDAEFTGLHRNTSLISIGMVTDTGSYFYAESTDYDKSQINDWLQENVIGNLKLQHTSPYCRIRGINEPGYCDEMIRDNTERIRGDLLTWLQMELNKSGKKQIQFYTDCYAYDWMILVDLLTGGKTALDMPSWIYYIPYDLSTLMQSNEIDPDVTREDFISEDEILKIKGQTPFTWWGDNCKHNSLWDAAVARSCFHGIYLMNSAVCPRGINIAIAGMAKSLQDPMMTGTGINTVNFRGVQIPENN